MNTLKQFPILLPKNVDMQKWAVIACDQYTTDAPYWDKLENFVDSAKSTLRLIFPEIYLSSNIDERIKSINKTMREYVDGEVFTEHNCYVLVERALSDGRNRVGLVACVDLDEYEFTRTDCAILPTEQTIEERLPVRIHIRENAPLELPHILLLLDDAKKSIIEPLYAKKDSLNKLYDFDLNMNGGHICGYEIPYDSLPLSLFDALLDSDLQKEKYGKNAGLLFAVGDGNHSMATAKKCWEKIKPTLNEKERENHPARFCLVEILNVYDDALDFLPIHRNVTGISEEEFVSILAKKMDGDGKLTLVTKSGEITLPCYQDYESEKTIIAVQSCLETLKAEKGVQIEYVHEEEQVRSTVEKDGGIGIIMPFFPKNKLFNYVVNYGKLPKKAFSIGEEKTKKYYIESKKIN